VTNALTPAHETAEVVHEALIRQWPRLAGWINQDRAFLSWLRQIRSNADQWLADPTDDGPLLRGGMLAQAEDWSKRRDDDFSPDERRYIKTGLALRDREADAVVADQRLQAPGAAQCTQQARDATSCLVVLQSQQPRGLRLRRSSCVFGADGQCACDDGGADREHGGHAGRATQPACRPSALALFVGEPAGGFGQFPLSDDLRLPGRFACIGLPVAQR
jgi:hypothetical protein